MKAGLFDQFEGSSNRGAQCMRYFRQAGRTFQVSALLTVLVMMFLLAGPLLAQETNQVAAASSTAAPLTITLQDALTRGRANEPQYRSALTQYGVARENRVQSRAALLPNVNYNAEFLYTQGNGTSTGRFVGANGVHEYVSEGNAHQE